MSQRKYEAVVDKGVAHLDDIAPKWRKKITEKIDMSSQLKCVAAQVYEGWYSNALIKLFPHITSTNKLLTLGISHGFSVQRVNIMTKIDKKDWQTLGKEWERRI